MQSRISGSLALVLALWVAGLCAAAQFAKISLIFPELRAIYADAGAAAGFLLSLVSLLGVVFGLVAGIVVARFGFRSLLLFALLLGALVSLYQATMPSFELMLASRLIEGASHLLIVVAAPTLIAQVSSDRYRPAAMTLWGTFFGVAYALVAWLGLPLTAAYGLHALFVAHGAAMALTAAILYLALPPAPAPVATAAPLGIASIAARHVAAYRSPFVAAPAAGWLFYTLAFVSTLTLLPDYVQPQDRVLVATAMPLASIVSSMTLGVAVQRYASAIHVIVLGFALSAVFAVLLWFVPAAPWICIGLFAAFGLVQGASFAAVPELNGDMESRALANGAMAQMGNLGNLCGTPLLVLATASFGQQGLVAFALLCFGGGAVAHMLCARLRRA
jgi:MFS transporter, DHA1 family, inner membrane transport protein